MAKIIHDGLFKQVKLPSATSAERHRCSFGEMTLRADGQLLAQQDIRIEVEDATVLRERRQMFLVQDEITPMADWLIGTEPLRQFSHRPQPPAGAAPSAVGRTEGICSPTHQAPTPPRRPAHGAFEDGEKRSVGGGARSALRQLTRRRCPSAANRR